MKKARNYSLHHADNPHIDDVTNHEGGRCTFMLDTIPDECFREIRLMKGDRCLFTIGVGRNGVRYEINEEGEDIGCFTLWDDEYS